MAILFLILLLCALDGDGFALGILGIIVTIYIISELLVKFQCYIDKKYKYTGSVAPRYNDSEEKSYKQADGESYYHWTKRLQNDIVDDDFGNEVYISSDRKFVVDEFGNRIYDIDEISEVYIKDSKGHYHKRNNYK